MLELVLTIEEKLMWRIGLLARCSTPYFITGFRTTTILLSFVLYCKLKQSHFDKIVGRLHFTATAFDNRRVQAERMISMLTKFPRGWIEKIHSHLPKALSSILSISTTSYCQLTLATNIKLHGDGSMVVFGIRHARFCQVNNTHQYPRLCILEATPNSGNSSQLQTTGIYVA